MLLLPKLIEPNVCILSFLQRKGTSENKVFNMGAASRGTRGQPPLEIRHNYRRHSAQSTGLR